MPDEPDLLDEIGTPACPVHLVPLVIRGEDLTGRDARWECPIEGCPVARLS